jgi:phage terminase large subunit-like protein
MGTIRDVINSMPAGQLPSQAAIEKELKRIKYTKIERFFKNEGELNRHEYAKHMRFFAQGRLKRVRAFIAANRVGKSLSGNYESTLHLTGDYDKLDCDWQGKRFDRPIEAWICGITGDKTRTSLQEELIGKMDDFGTGMIPKDYIIKQPNGAAGTKKAGVSKALDTVKIKHYTDGENDGTSEIKFKSYKEGLLAFEAESVDLIHLDEECPQDIYVSCVLRTMTTGGCVYLTMTPLQGMTPMLLNILEKEKGKVGVTVATWDDAPHLSEDVKVEMLDLIPEYQRDARSKGIPQLGSGSIYKTSVDKVFIDPIAIPKHWPRVYGLDVGWNNTAMVWAAWDRDNDIVYVYGETKEGEKTPAEHAITIKSRGVTPGVVDPASQGRSQDRGKTILDQYEEAGCELTPADNAVEHGISEIYQMLKHGKLKIFSTCGGLKDEYRLYRRDKNGKIVKSNDHLLDALRYLIRSGLPLAITPMEEKEKLENRDDEDDVSDLPVMATTSW